MPGTLANEFGEILPVLLQNEKLCNAVLLLVSREPVVGKVTEGGNRLDTFRSILKDLVNGQISLNAAIHSTRVKLSPQSSLHSGNNRVFAANWEERLVRTQLSRFYNQAVMETLMAEGETLCFVPHSTSEDSNSPCSLQLAGANHDLKMLHERLVESYGRDNWPRVTRIPNHPHCTHVVTRAE